MRNVRFLSSVGRRAPQGRAKRLGLGAAVAVMLVGGLAPLASSTPATDGNPDLPSVCGLDVTLVLDDSTSIDGTEANQVRTAASTFASALVGTPSRLKVVVFDTKATGIQAAGTSTSNLNNIVFRDPALYTAPTSGAGQGEHQLGRRSRGHEAEQRWPRGSRGVHHRR